MEQVIALDPDNKAARQALGYQRVGEKWFTHDELMQKKGFVRYHGEWLTPEDVAIREEKSSQTAAEKEWISKLATWQAWLGGSRAETARDNILKIDDPAAVPAWRRPWTGIRTRGSG